MAKKDSVSPALSLAESSTAALGAQVAPLMMQPSDEQASEHRRFPRAPVGVAFSLWIDDGHDRRFSATLHSENLSVSGAFLQSTFFLPLGTELSVSFSLEGNAEPVQARAQVVRAQRSPGDARSPLATGMGVRFVAFHAQTEVTLARLFLGTALRHFVDAYLASPRARAFVDPTDRVVDALAAWELSKVSGSAPRDPWGAPPPAAR